MSAWWRVFLQIFPAWLPRLRQNDRYCQSQFSKGLHWTVCHNPLLRGCGRGHPTDLLVEGVCDTVRPADGRRCRRAP